MTVALFVPCYVDQFYPQVAVATLRLLERLDCEVVYPEGQTCCGQPMANSGFEGESVASMHRFVEAFRSYDYVVGPSGSCVLHVREHYDKLAQTSEVAHVRERTYELCQFLTDVLDRPGSGGALSAPRRAARGLPRAARPAPGPTDGTARAAL